MDTLTHAISGAVIGAATSPKDPVQMRRRALWGALFAAFPDADAVIALFADHFTYLNAHRGHTHSILLLPAWAALLGWIGAHFSKQRWREMAILAAATLAAHILGDVITSYGTRVFTPLSSVPLAYPITFIIDPIFTGILLAGLVAALLRSKPFFATVSGIVLLCYLVLQAYAQHQATRIGWEYAESLGAPQAPVVAFPQPLSPFNWKVVVVSGETYHRAYVNLLADEKRAQPAEDASFVTRLRAAYQPREALDWKTYQRWPEDTDYRAVAATAWQQPAFEGFRKFALLPYVTSMRGEKGNVCVWFTDMRFTVPARPAPFEYAMCYAPDTGWALRMDAEK